MFLASSIYSPVLEDSWKTFEEMRSVGLSSPTAFPGMLVRVALVAQWIERLPPEQEVVGSNPIEGTM